MEYLINWKFFLMIFIMFSGSVILVSSQNETIYIDDIEEKEKVNCTEQLTWLITEYNNLTEDYKEGINCGTITGLLTDNNAKLSDNLKICNKDLEGYKDYKAGFWMMFSIGIIFSIYLIIIWIINLRRKK